MRKIIIILVLVIATNPMLAQIQAAKIIGKNGDNISVGYGGFFKLAYNITTASDVSAEVGALIFPAKRNTVNNTGWGVIPLKAGYRYIVTGKNAGPYVEPQVGYNIMGLTPADKNFSGFVWGIGTGYQFKPLGIVKFDLGIRFESALYQGGTLNYVILRFAHSFRFGYKRYDE